MSCCSPPCRIQYGFPPQGPFINQGHPGATMNHGPIVSMNQVPFSALCSDLSGGKCVIQGGMNMLNPAQPGFYNPPNPCPVQIAEPCDAKSSKICASPCTNPMPESWDDKGGKKHISICTNPTPEPGGVKSPPPPPAAKRCNPPLPPRYLPPKVSGCPPPDGPKFGELRGFPASSRCFPPREMYHYTTSKTYKLCYAK